MGDRGNPLLQEGEEVNGWHDLSSWARGRMFRLCVTGAGYARVLAGHLPDTWTSERNLEARQGGGTSFANSAHCVVVTALESSHLTSRRPESD